MTHYSDNPHSKYYQWNWCRDEFNAPLTANELHTYIKHPDRFRKDFLDNLKLYNKFCYQLYKHIDGLGKLPAIQKIVVLTTLLFLFQSAMDQHYSKFDNLLDLEEYSGSPLGWHYLRMRKIVSQVSENIEETMLHLLTKRGIEQIYSMKNHLSKKYFEELLQSYAAVSIFIKVQQEEEVLFFGKHQDGIIYKTGYKLVKNLLDCIESTNDFCLKKEEVVTLLTGEPSYGTRKLLVDMDMYFAEEVVNGVKSAIKNWK